MADNNVFILFEEIKYMLNGMKSKLEELPKVISNVILKPIGTLGEQLKDSDLQWGKLPQEYIHRHSLELQNSMNSK